MGQRMVSPQVARVLLAAAFAPFVEVPLLMLWTVAAETMGPPMVLATDAGPESFLVRALLQGLLLGVVSLPFASAATLLVGVPVALLWLRFFNRISLVAIIALGALLSLGPAFVLGAWLSRGNYNRIGATWLAFCAVSGALIAATAWWLAFGRRHDHAAA